MASRSTRNPVSLTKTQQLRQAKSAAFVRDYEQKKETVKTQPAGIPKARKKVIAEPKKVDFCKPTMTKAMLARVKQAEKFKEEYERKREEATAPGRRPKRTAAPVGGDARMGKERAPRKPGPPAPSQRAGPSQTIPSRRKTMSPSRLDPIPEKTIELARSMNADIIQAEPMSEGPIDSIVIPPGAVNDNRTTIVCIPQPTGAPAGGEASGGSQIANRSIQVISETLDEQDAAESVAVQGKLEELQQARRDFVIAVANVGGNAVNIGEEVANLSMATRPPARAPPPLPVTPPRRIYKIPDVEDEQFRVEFQRDHPDVVAAREFAQRSMAALRDREAARRMEAEFERLARQPVLDELRLDVPFEEELYHEGDISWEEDEETGMILPQQSRIKASMPVIPARQEHYQYQPFNPEDLERFFDVDRYPAASPPCMPPPGREDLNPDLWELDDPWYIPPPEPEAADLIDFDSF